MKRFWSAAIIAGMSLAGAASYAATTDTGSETFTVGVGDIVAFITNKSDPTTGSNLTSWDTTGASAGTYYSDSVATFRLVMNKDITLSADVTSGILKEGATAETDDQLATFWTLYTDGDGTQGASPTVFTGQAWSGVLAATQSSNAKYGVSAASTGTPSTLDFVYVGGAAASTAATDTTTPTFAVPDTTSAPSATVNYYYAAAGTNWNTTPPTTATISAGSFLNGATGLSVKHVSRDGLVLVTVRCRGINGEDFGANKDSTEAPDSGTYTAAMTLTATY